MKTVKALKDFNISAFDGEPMTIRTGDTIKMTDYEALIRSKKGQVEILIKPENRQTK